MKTNSTIVNKAKSENKMFLTDFSVQTKLTMGEDGIHLINIESQLLIDFVVIQSIFSFEILGIINDNGIIQKSPTE